MTKEIITPKTQAQREHPSRQTAREALGIDKLSPFQADHLVMVRLRIEYLSGFYNKETLTQLYLYWIGEGKL